MKKTHRVWSRFFGKSNKLNPTLRPNTEQKSTIQKYISINVKDTLNKYIKKVVDQWRAEILRRVVPSPKNGKFNLKQSWKEQKLRNQTKNCLLCFCCHKSMQIRFDQFIVKNSEASEIETEKDSQTLNKYIDKFADTTEYINSQRLHAMCLLLLRFYRYYGYIAIFHI